MTKTEQDTRDLAYRLWEREGRPEGRHEDHWRQAEQMLGSAQSDEKPKDVTQRSSKPRHLGKEKARI